MKKLFLGLIALNIAIAQAQTSVNPADTSWKTEYRAAATKINDLVHTKLDVTPDYEKCYLYGKAWITLTPHYYATDSLRLDAKGMTIKEVALLSGKSKKPLKYVYNNGHNLYITLDKKYTKGEKYTIFIDYISKPNEYKTHGSSAITDAKGLYFINPDGKTPNKPTQLWTQGETEGSSVWFPTIDRPDQKTTEEIALTVPNKYVTLSNGYLASSKKNSNGTRTDDWKMDLPNAPYLFFFGVGNYSVVKDHYKKKEVNYYVEPEYASVAKRIFGNTPEMIAFYSRILKYEYPWNKYDQMTARDYVSGAMENTTATLHTDALQQNARQLSDGNQYEEYVAHELFHQWFGDLVTTKSWSNLTVNESFANYSETLWDEYKYGPDAGAKQNYEDMEGYLRNPANADKDLVRYYYKDKEDMFDAVSYNKGGRILNMLRHYLGDSAFFDALHKYLVTNQFGNGTATKLKLAFEDVTGQDLNWYWNQWYYGNGHPKLDISYDYSNPKNAAVIIKQTQNTGKIFKLPIDVDVYVNGAKKRYRVWDNAATDTFHFEVAQKPDLINVDGDKILLAEKDDHKTMSEFAYQYDKAGNYVDRIEAVSYALENPTEAGAAELIQKGLTDKFYAVRALTINSLTPNAITADTKTRLVTIAKSDDHRKVRADAIRILGMFKDASYEPIFEAGLTDSSYSVAGASLNALAQVNKEKAIAAIPNLKKDARGSLKNAVANLELASKGDADFDEVYNNFSNSDVNSQFGQLRNYITFLGNLKNVSNLKKGVSAITDLRDKYAEQAPQLKTFVDNAIANLAKEKSAKGETEAANYLNSLGK